MSILDFTNLRWSDRLSHFFATDRNYTGSYLLVSPDGMRVVDCRSYWAGGMTNRARVWLCTPGNGRSAYGVGRSTGYGYDRAGAAIADALADAGVKGLSSYMSGKDYILGLLRKAMEELWNAKFIKIETYA